MNWHLSSLTFYMLSRLSLRVAADHLFSACVPWGGNSCPQLESLHLDSGIMWLEWKSSDTWKYQGCGETECVSPSSDRGRERIIRLYGSSHAQPAFDRQGTNKRRLSQLPLSEWGPHFLFSSLLCSPNIFLAFNVELSLYLPQYRVTRNCFWLFPVLRL